MGIDYKFSLARLGNWFPTAPLSTDISGEWRFLDPSMNPRLLEGLQRRRLSVGQPRFGAALGKSPPPAATSPNQQELDAAAAHPVANRGDLFAFAQLAKFRQSNELSRCRMSPAW